MLFDLRVLTALQRKVEHQTLVAENESDDGFLDVVGIDAVADTVGDDRDTAVDARLPAVAGAKSFERFLSHEHDDFGARLNADLGTPRD